MNKVHVKLIEEKELDIMGGDTSSSYAVVIFSDDDSETLYYSEFNEMIKLWNPEAFFLNISKDIEDRDLKYRFLETIETSKGFYYKVARSYVWIEIE
ncbi:hypothetical protein H7K13_23695 [Priestia aryabhattai]|uniref:hypothetical protein n=1 Tax=Priestia aryabhattai TaxID=412384 RepID=UPI001C8E28DE|nr:hypothetical protein [Priestia aryabhattai]MBY0077934.1 hypothetical protein [Priestia aryabhattai]